MVDNGQPQPHRRLRNAMRNVQGATSIFASMDHYNAARERGRRMAAEALMCDAEKRREMEDEYGVANCRIQYPEAYGLKTLPRIVLP